MNISKYIVDRRVDADHRESSWCGLLLAGVQSGGHLVHHRGRPSRHPSRHTHRHLRRHGHHLGCHHSLPAGDQEQEDAGDSGRYREVSRTTDISEWYTLNLHCRAPLCSCRGKKVGKRTEENSWISEPEKKGGGLHMSPSSVSLG